MENIDLDKILIEFADALGKTPWTIRDSVQGLSVFGGTGGGKTSGSGNTFAKKYLSNGFGGLVLTVKPDEKEMWQGYCRATGRENDLIIIEPGGKHQFNFLEYESSHLQGGVSLTANIVQVLKTVIRAGDEKSGGGSDDIFWERSLDMLMTFTCDLCKLAYGKVTVRKLYDIAMSAPQKQQVTGNSDEAAEAKQEEPSAFDEAFSLARDKVDAKGAEWFETLSQSVQESLQDPKKYGDAIMEMIPDARLFKEMHQFFTRTFPNLSGKTRSTIEFIFSGFLYRLLQDPFYSLFCDKPSTVTPDDCLNGKIILINLPVKTYYSVGRDCQIMFKYIWQRAIERRDVKKNGRVVFLWSDEAQTFLHEFDAETQATARSSRIATVYLSQNLPNYLASMSGSKAEYRVKSFLGTLATKIFHANADPDTNMLASQLIGEAYVRDESRNVNMGGEFNIGKGTSWKLEKMVRPEKFVSLKTGGPLNKNLVEAYIHHQGTPFHNGFNFFKATFSQL